MYDTDGVITENVWF